MSYFDAYEVRDNACRTKLCGTILRARQNKTKAVMHKTVRDAGFICYTRLIYRVMMKKAKTTTIAKHLPSSI